MKAMVTFICFVKVQPEDNGIFYENIIFINNKRYDKLHSVNTRFL